MDATTNPDALVLATRRRESSWKLMVWLLVFFVATAPLVISVAVSPADIESGRVVLSPPCNVKRLTGHDCPTCGLSRAFASIGHGDVPGALRYHRASVVVYGVYCVVSLVAFAGAVRESRRLLTSRRTEPCP